MRALYANEPGKPSTSPGTMAHGGKMSLDSSYQPEPITHGYVDGKKVPFAAQGGKVPFDPKKALEEFSDFVRPDVSSEERAANAIVAANKTNAAIDKLMAEDKSLDRWQAADRLRDIAKGRPVPKPTKPAPTPTKTPSPASPHSPWHRIVRPTTPPAG